MSAVAAPDAMRLAREHLARQIELVPCRPDGVLLIVHDPTEYVFFQIVDRGAGLHVGAGRYVSVHLPTGAVREFESGE